MPAFVARDARGIESGRKVSKLTDVGMHARNAAAKKCLTFNAPVSRHPVATHASSV